MGPASSAFIAAVATAWVFGISRRTGARPALSVKLPRKKYARTIVVPVGAFDGAGVVVGSSVGASAGEDEGDAGADGLAVGAVAGDGDERSGVASSDGASTDGRSVGGGVAGVPSGPDVGEQAAARSATSARTRNGLGRWFTNGSVLRVPMPRQRPFRPCPAHRPRVTVGSPAG